MPDFPPADIFTVYTYDVDGNFAKDESLFGGPVSIDGIFLMAYISKLEADDGDGSSSLYINGKYTSATQFYREHEYEGLWDSAYFFFGEKVDTPHTSFDIKSWESTITYFHRTYKVIIVNRTT